MAWGELGTTAGTQVPGSLTFLAYEAKSLTWALYSCSWSGIAMLNEHCHPFSTRSLQTTSLLRTRRSKSGTLGICALRDHRTYFTQRSLFERSPSQVYRRFLHQALLSSLWMQVAKLDATKSRWVNSDLHGRKEDLASGFRLIREGKQRFLLKQLESQHLRMLQGTTWHKLNFKLFGNLQSANQDQASQVPSIGRVSHRSSGPWLPTILVHPVSLMFAVPFCFRWWIKWFTWIIFHYS